MADNKGSSASNKAAAAAALAGRTVEETYTQLTQREHILLRPDTVPNQPLSPSNP